MAAPFRCECGAASCRGDIQGFKHLNPAVWPGIIQVILVIYNMLWPGIIQVILSFIPCLRSTLRPYTPNDVDVTVYHVYEVLHGHSHQMSWMVPGLNPRRRRRCCRAPRRTSSCCTTPRRGAPRSSTPAASASCSGRAAWTTSAARRPCSSPRATSSPGKSSPPPPVCPSTTAPPCTPCRSGH